MPRLTNTHTASSLYLLSKLCVLVWALHTETLILTLSIRSACTLLACLNNPVLNGEDAFNNIDLRVIDDIDAADSAETVKVPLHSTVPAGAARYEDQSAGLGYVRYDSLHGRA